MGVPKFFRWLIDNKSITQNAFLNWDITINKENSIIYNGNKNLNIDILYLDANQFIYKAYSKISNYYDNIIKHIVHNTGNYRINNNIIEIAENESKKSYVNAMQYNSDEPLTIINNFLPKPKNKIIFKLITDEIENIIGIVKPKIIYIGFDGVAPMAKILQQRKRRYKYVADETMYDKLRIKYNIPKYDFAISMNASPKTKFMKLLNKYFKKYIINKKILIKNNIIGIKKIFKYINQYLFSIPNLEKINLNKIKNIIEMSNKILIKLNKIISKKNIDSQNYKNIKEIIFDIKKKINVIELKNDFKFIYSSDKKNGEGEHKIFKHIDVNNYNNIMIFGLDTDLIFLSLCCKKKNIYLLREQTSFTKNELLDNTCNNFNILDIDILKQNCYNIMKNKSVINIKKKETLLDFVFICFLIGNDFIPNMLSINIYSDINNGVNVLIETYRKIDGNICNKDGIFNNENFNKFLNLLKEKEIFSLKQKYKYNNYIYPHEPLFGYYLEKHNVDFLNDVKIPDKLMLGNDNKWIERYYNYFFNTNNKEIINEICKNYIEGLVWILQYYIGNIKNKQWYYRYSYAPLLASIVDYIKINNFDINKIKFKKNSFVSANLQKICIIPPKYKYILSEKYRDYNNSEIKYMFPDTFSQEMIYQRYLFSCIPKLPNIDINKIIEYIKNKK